MNTLRTGLFESPLRLRARFLARSWRLLAFLRWLSRPWRWGRLGLDKLGVPAINAGRVASQTADRMAQAKTLTGSPNQALVGALLRRAATRPSTVGPPRRPYARRVRSSLISGGGICASGLTSIGDGA